jgi:dolichyl-phosphate beta-glucosyltransferase
MGPVRVRRPLARFAVVGSLVTAIDVGVFLAVFRLLDRHNLIVADVAAVLAATVASLWLQGALTFRGDPYARWLGERRKFVITALISLLVDVGTLLVVAGGTSPTMERAAVAKVVAVGVAGVARWVLHRRVLLSIVRSEHVPRADRRSAPGDVRLSVVLPAYCEADRITGAVAEVRAALASLEGGVEVLVVDDGSTDGTADLARAAGADHVIVQPTNRGKGAAVRTGVLEARGRTIAFTDADLSYSPDQLRGLVDQVEAGWDVVVGSRKHERTRTLVQAGRLRELGGRVINWLTYSVLLGHYRDTQCGLKAFRSDVGRQMFERAQVDGFAFDVELFVIVERNNLALTEVPVTVSNTTRSTVHVARDALRLVRDLFRIRRRAREGQYQLSEAVPARQ